MKSIIITILLTLAGFGAMAETDTNTARMESLLNSLTEEAFKAGVVVGHGYTLLGLATNIDGLTRREAGHQMAEQAWGDFQEFQKKHHPNWMLAFLDTKGAVMITNGAVSNTVPLEVSGVLETNWTTTSIESPVVGKGHEWDAVMRYDQQHQAGTVISNTVATFKWNNKTISAVVESVELFHTNRIISQPQVIEK